MSQIFFRLSKLSPLNNAFRHKKSSRLFSSSVTFTLGTRLTKTSPDGSEIRDVLFLDPAKEEILTVSDKTFPEELVNSRQIGSSHGWGLFYNDQDRSLCISDIYKPLASKSNPKMIPLPSFIPLPTNQPDIVWNVAMSSSPCDEDCVVGVKFLGRQLSLSRPHHDWRRWTNINVIPDESLEKLETSNLMFSKKDQRFYLPAPGGNQLYSWDLHLEKKNKCPEIHQVLFRDIPKLDESDWGLLDVCCRKEYMVESSGQRFLVKWYAQGYFSSSREKIEYMTRRFMVFREEETMERSYMCYTEDIGDVCIFLSKSEAFCVESSSCPGLKANSIYYLGHGSGVYSIADKTSQHFQAREGAPTSFKDPYWLPPSCV